MARICDLCGKRTRVGNHVTRRGLAKKKGGVGRRVTGRSKRRYKPNLQRVRAVVGGTVRRVRLCTDCLRRGSIRKPA